jgi:hypothetical protein
MSKCPHCFEDLYATSDIHECKAANVKEILDHQTEGYGISKASRNTLGVKVTELTPQALEQIKRAVHEDYEILKEEHGELSRQAIFSEMNLPEAVEKLCQELKKDKELWRAWRDNISIAFQDEYRNVAVKSRCDKAADRFLQNLTRNYGD